MKILMWLYFAICVALALTVIWSLLTTFVIHARPGLAAGPALVGIIVVLALWREAD